MESAGKLLERGRLTPSNLGWEKGKERVYGEMLGWCRPHNQKYMGTRDNAEAGLLRVKGTAARQTITLGPSHSKPKRDHKISPSTFQEISKTYT